jgi:hypothetical protein
MEPSVASASLVAPPKVATGIDKFGRAIGPFLNMAGGDPGTCSLTAEEFEQASLAPAYAQLSLVNAIRQSLGKDLGALSVWIGGSLVNPPRWRE